MTAIEASGVTKIYRRYARRRQFATLKSAILSGTLIGDLAPEETFSAVKDVSFTVKKGSTFGVVGRNGSGKSTMLKLVAGITKPTAGTMTVTGRISALIELGAGFHPEISGRENIFINGIMLGLSRREIKRRFDEIVEFAELQDFIDAPVKTYSSGMYMRLGFAVAIHVDPDVLLVDEVLAVGDESFTHKCLDKFAEFRRRGKTILLVTHSLSLVERFCDEALWLDAGQSRGIGDPRRIVSAYITDVERSEERHLAAVEAKARLAANAPAGGANGAVGAAADERTDREEGIAIAAPTSSAVPADSGIATETPLQPATAPQDSAPADMFRAGEGRWGSREAEILDVQLYGDNGEPGHVFSSGERVEIRLAVRARKPIDDFAVGIAFFNVDGICCYGTNTHIEELEPDHFVGDGEVRFLIETLDLVEGSYKVDVALHKLDGYPYDYHRLLYSFRVKSRTKDVGVYRPRHTWTFAQGIRFRQSVGE
jgi:lipopolysaccharide transport system ATP-binding protein